MPTDEDMEKLREIQDKFTVVVRDYGLPDDMEEGEWLDKMPESDWKQYSDILESRGIYDGFDLEDFYEMSILYKKYSNS